MKSSEVLPSETSQQLPQDHYNKLFRFIQIATVCVFAGRAWQHLFWDAPYRELFWDPAFMKGIVEGLTGLSWEEYVTHPSGDKWFQRFVLVQGVFYTFCAVVAAYIRKLPGWARIILLIGAGDLIFLALVYLKDHFYHLGQFFEFSLQFGAPIFLYYLLEKKVFDRRLSIGIKVAISLTFTCHGLYAVGYYPIPGNFQSMTEQILGLKGDMVTGFLKTVGILDFIISFLIFLPGRTGRIAILYAAAWGALTSFARIIANFYPEYPLESLHMWLYQTVYRLPHLLIPLALFFGLRKKGRKP